jgi:hypothetical protein
MMCTRSADSSRPASSLSIGANLELFNSIPGQIPLGICKSWACGIIPRVRHPTQCVLQQFSRPPRAHWIEYALRKPFSESVSVARLNELSTLLCIYLAADRSIN